MTNNSVLILLGNVNSPHIQKLICCFDGLFREIHVYSIHPVSDSVNSIITNSGDGLVVRVAPFARLKIPDSVKYLLGGFLLRFALKKSQFNCIRVNAHYASGYGVMALVACWPNPYYVSIWGSDLTEFPHRSILHKFVLFLVLRLSASILVTSEFLRLELGNCFPHLSRNKSLFVTPFCVQDQFFDVGAQKLRNYPCSDVVTIGFAKTLKEIYNVELLLRAYQRLLADLSSDSEPPRSQPRVRLLIAGGGERLVFYQALAATLGISGAVDFWGPQSPEEMPAFYGLIDIYMAISSAESFGVSALEASASAVPIISSGVGGLAEVVIDRETGIVLKDLSVDSLVSAMMLLVGDRELRKVYGINAFCHARSHYRMPSMKSSFVHAFR
jgi:glycosyltransferase involved in cell wall biosynthesis